MLVVTRFVIFEEHHQSVGISFSAISTLLNFDVATFRRSVDPADLRNQGQKT